MSYYLTLIGTRDNPLYEAEIVSKSGPSNSAASSSSFFSAVTPAALTSSVTGSSTNSKSQSSTAGSGTVEQDSIGSPVTTGSSMFGGLLSRLPTAATTAVGNTAASAPTSATATGNPASSSSSSVSRRKHRYELQQIAHSSLDTIEDALITSQYLYLKSIDRIQEFSTSCFVTPNNIKFVLLHEHKHEEGIKNFFLDIWEAYLKISLNPFQDANSPIENAAFEARVRAAARKFL